MCCEGLFHFGDTYICMSETNATIGCKHIVNTCGKNKAQKTPTESEEICFCLNKYVFPLLLLKLILAIAYFTSMAIRAKWYHCNTSLKREFSLLLSLSLLSIW